MFPSAPPPVVHADLVWWFATRYILMMLGVEPEAVELAVFYIRVLVLYLWPQLMQRAMISRHDFDPVSTCRMSVLQIFPVRATIPVGRTSSSFSDIRRESTVPEIRRGTGAAKGSSARRR
eukprot:SAG22_NODE_164_length_16817_cov_61.573573_10_plen_120_part_00